VRSCRARTSVAAIFERGPGNNRIDWSPVVPTVGNAFTIEICVPNLFFRIPAELEPPFGAVILHGLRPDL